MRQQNNIKTPIVFRIALVLLCVMLFSFYLIGGLYARYTASASGGDSARVPLVMAIKVEGSAAAVEAAISAGKAEAEKRELYITHKVIARQSEDIEWFARLSALGKDKLR